MSEIDTNREAVSALSARLPQNYSDDLWRAAKTLEALAAERDAAVARAEKAEAERDDEHDKYLAEHGLVTIYTTADFPRLRARVAALEAALNELGEWIAKQAAKIDRAADEGGLPEAVEELCDAMRDGYLASFREQCRPDVALSAPPAPAMPHAADAVLAERFVEAAENVRGDWGDRERIQVFSYTREYIVRDVWRRDEEQEIWRGADKSEAERQAKIARVKLILAEIERLDRLTSGEGE